LLVRPILHTQLIESELSSWVIVAEDSTALTSSGKFVDPMVTKALLDMRHTSGGSLL
jgi:hypothetical protein